MKNPTRKETENKKGTLTINVANGLIFNAIRTIF